MSKVSCIPTGKVDPDAILEMAKGELTETVVIGWDKKGKLWVSSSCDRLPDVVYLMECGKDMVIRG